MKKHNFVPIVNRLSHRVDRLKLKKMKYREYSLYPFSAQDKLYSIKYNVCFKLAKWIAHEDI